MLQNHSKTKTGGGARGGRILRSIVLIIFTILFEISPAQAQVIPPIPTYDPYSPTTTPGPTNTPFYGPTIQPPIWEVTSTPEFLGDCPTTSRDYERELSFNYVRKCYQCIDNPTTIPTLQGGINNLEYQPTNQFGSTPTPITDNPTPTPTPPNETLVLQTDRTGYENLANIPNGYPVSVGYTDKWRNYVPDIYYKTFAPYPPQTVTETYYVQADFTIAMMEPNTSFHGYQGGFQYFGYCNAQGGCKLELENGTVINQTKGQLYVIYEQLFDNNQAGLIQSGVMNFKVEFTHGNADEYRNYEFTLKKIGDYYWEKTSLSYLFTWDYDPIDLTPDPVGYCSEWEYQDQVPEGPPLLTLPNLEIWQGACTQLIPPFDWFRDSSGSYVFDINFNFPGFSVCPVWVDITPFSLAGINIPFEIMYLPALTWLLDAILKL